MQTYNTVYEYHLGKLIGEAIEAQKEAISHGNMTLENYKYTCGIIQGLKKAFDLMAEADRVAHGGNNEEK